MRAPRYGEQLQAVPVGDNAVRILAFVMNYQATVGYPPSVREICRALRLSSTSTVHEHLKRLRRLGLVDWQDGASRTLRSTLTIVAVAS